MWVNSCCRQVVRLLESFPQIELQQNPSNGNFKTIKVGEITMRMACNLRVGLGCVDGGCRSAGSRRIADS